MTDIGTLLDGREKTHGSFDDVATCAQALKEIMRRQRNWSALSPRQREALDSNAVKQARILNGDPTYPDHWKDIAGYAMLACREMEKEQKA